MTGNRGKMLHLILTICQKVEKAFNKIVDGGEGGERLCTNWSWPCIFFERVCVSDAVVWPLVQAVACRRPSGLLLCAVG